MTAITQPSKASPEDSKIEFSVPYKSNLLFYLIIGLANSHY